MNIAEMFGIKSTAQRKQEQKMYDQWAFPYGPAQKAKLQQILKELMPQEDDIFRMAVYLIGREGYIGSFKLDAEELAARTEAKKMTAMDYALRGQLWGKSKKDLPFYKAVILADAQIDENLNYPSVEELRELAEKLKN